MAFDQQNQLLYIADTENHALRRINLKLQVVGNHCWGQVSKAIIFILTVVLVGNRSEFLGIGESGDRLLIAMAGPIKFGKCNCQPASFKPTLKLY